MFTVSSPCCGWCDLALRRQKIGYTKQLISRWIQRLKDLDEYRARLIDALRRPIPSQRRNASLTRDRHG
jgi:hypothetical protein